MLCIIHTLLSFYRSPTPAFLPGSINALNN